MMDIVSNIDYKSLIKIDSLGKSKFRLIFNDGSEQETKLTQSDTMKIRAEWKKAKETEGLVPGESPVKPSESGGKPVKTSESGGEPVKPPEYEAPFRYKESGYLDITFRDPNLVGFWCKEYELQKRLSQMKYDFARKEDLVDYEYYEQSLMPGEGSAPDGMIKRNDLYLLKIHKDGAAKLRDYYESSNRNEETEKNDYISRGGLQYSGPIN